MVMKYIKIKIMGAQEDPMVPIRTHLYPSGSIRTYKNQSVPIRSKLDTWVPIMTYIGTNIEMTIASLGLSIHVNMVKMMGVSLHVNIHT